jgi:hypothetical protein
MMQCHVKRDMVEQFTKNSADDEIPEQVWFGYHLRHLLGWGFRLLVPVEHFVWFIVSLISSSVICLITRVLLMA